VLSVERDTWHQNRALAEVFTAVNDTSRVSLYNTREEVLGCAQTAAQTAAESTVLRNH
jgi:hypothetical protein